MNLAIVFGFAVQDGLVPIVGAAPYDVIARQLPRQLVQLLNAGADRGARFFPFLGNAGGKRTFLRLREPLPVATLASLHKHDQVVCMVDGAIADGSLHMRVHDGESHRLVREVELPFDPRKPYDVLVRAQFEVMSVLGWEGRPQAAPKLSDAALAWFLIAKDELLSLEAAVASEPGSDPLRAARECIAQAADVPVAQDIVIETVAYLLRASKLVPEAVQLLQRLAAAAPVTFELCRRIGALQQAAGDESGAALTWTRAAGLQPDNAEAVEIAASLWFRIGRLQDAHEVLARARSLNALSAAGMGQLAAVADRRGDRALRVELTAELLRLDSLPLPVARLVTSFLLEEDRAHEALVVADRAIARSPQDAGMWLEVGRACLLLDDCTRAAGALRRALDQGLKGEPRRDAERLLRLCVVPGLFVAMRQVDAALSARDHATALRIAAQLVRRASDSAESWLFLGIVRQRLGHGWRAERALRRALGIDDNLGEAHNRLGILLLSQGNLDLGTQHLLRAGLLSPGDPAPRLHLAQAFALLGRVQEGERHLVEAERLGANPQTLAAIRAQFFARGA